MTVAIRFAVPTCALLAMLDCHPVSAETIVDCMTPALSIEAVSTADADLACAAASDAIPRLAAIGLTQHHPVRIKVTETLEHLPGASVAFYRSADREIQVLTPDCLEDPPARATAFTDMPAKVLFQSLIVHELTHALIDQRPDDRFVPQIVHEYLAYSIQIEALPEGERLQVLEQAEVSDPPDITRINEAILNVAPLYFAAAAWVFFTAQGGDAAHVQAVLDGDLLFDSLME